MRRPTLLWSAVLALYAALLVAPPGSAAQAETPVCSEDAGPGGDWPVYGSDLHATNNQQAEDVLDPESVSGLEVAWTVPGVMYQSKPIVSGRCMYYTHDGLVRAVDITTGQEVWAIDEPLPGGSGSPFAVAVVDGRVHVNFQNSGRPKAAAFDADTGALLWETEEEVWFGYPANQLSSAVVFDDIHILHTTGPDFDPNARPGYGLFDATDGRLIHMQTVIPEYDLDDGYAGGGVWGTPAVDPVTKHAFVGTSNPKSKNKEHRYDNAIIKIDLDRTRGTFGEVVDAYKGQSDAVVDSGYNTPVCDLGGSNPPGLFNLFCLQQDIDFGNGPTLWRNTNGELMAAQIQKSGLMHAVYADTMTRAWTVQLGTHNWLTGTGGNHGQAANDGERIYVASNPGLLWALEAATGRIEWVAPTAFPMQGMNVVVANGVVYSLDVAGVHAWDADTGLRLWEYPFPDAGQPCATTGSGITLAHNTLFVNCSRVYFTGTIAAFRLPS